MGCGFLFQRYDFVKILLAPWVYLENFVERIPCDFLRISVN